MQQYYLYPTYGHNPRLSIAGNSWVWMGGVRLMIVCAAIHMLEDMGFRTLLNGIFLSLCFNGIDLGTWLYGC